MRSRRIPGVEVSNQSLSQVMHRGRNRNSPVIVQPDSGVILECDIENIIIDKLGSFRTPSPFRYGKYLHVSDLLGKCMRMIAISYQTDTKINGDPIPNGLGVTFSIGEGIHDYVRRRMETANHQELYGEWTCLCHSIHIVGTRAEALKSNNCPYYSRFMCIKSWIR